MITKEFTQDILKRLVNEYQKEIILNFELEPFQAYTLVALVHLAVYVPDIPENSKEFGEAFVKAFCDRYREELPAMVESFELADQENFLMTREEFDDLTDDDYEDDFI